MAEVLLAVAAGWLVIVLLLVVLMHQVAKGNARHDQMAQQHMAEWKDHVDDALGVVDPEPGEFYHRGEWRPMNDVDLDEFLRARGLIQEADDGVVTPFKRTN